MFVVVKMLDMRGTPTGLRESLTINDDDDTDVDEVFTREKNTVYLEYTFFFLIEMGEEKKNGNRAPSQGYFICFSVSVRISGEVCALTCDLLSVVAEEGERDCTEAVEEEGREQVHIGGSSLVPVTAAATSDATALLQTSSLSVFLLVRRVVCAFEWAQKLCRSVPEERV